MAPRCSVIFGEEFTRHDLSWHDENSQRLVRALESVPHYVTRRPVEVATYEDLARVHHPRHIRMIEELCAYGGRRYLDMDTYVTEDSYQVALFAAGSSIAAARIALGGEHCFALIRPPGHHAEPDRAMGFCLFNNAAVAAAWALERVERVAIVDWDLHHGNGTQKIFYQSDRVLFCSIHQNNTFPWSGWIDEIGEGRGRGFNLNAPIPPGGRIVDYATVFSEVFAEAITHFGPDLVIISAGQDPLGDDPKGGMRLCPADFGVLTILIRDVSRCPLALVLEGGYGPSLGAAIGCILDALVGKKCPEPPESLPKESTRRIVRRLKTVMV
ncbi:MAG: Histone deacetylase domain protein [Methanoregulaceae archaeon PtaU1.Bin222]|nr:MAG: Histone deacetylase domain protein [Methanoregulaceae archaeon PtaU1.Bin222]